MSFAQRLHEDRFPVALEITPPRRSLPEVLIRRASLIGNRAHAVNVIQRPDRQPSLDACCELLDAGIDPVWHLVARGSSLASATNDIDRARTRGIHQVLCILGDNTPADAGAPSVRDLVAACSSGLPGVAVGATVNQYAQPRDRVLRNLEGKLAAGATYVQTQPVFDLEPLRSLVQAVHATRPSVHFVPMVMPIVDAAAARRVQERLGLSFPGPYLHRLEAGPDAAWAAFADLLASLRQSGLARGLAIMTLEMDPSPEVAERLVRALDRAGIGA